MPADRSRLRVAGVAFAVACLVLPSRSAAQGALDVTLPPAATEPSLAPARSVLHRLVGRWHFAVWFAGNLDGPPDASGGRVIEALYDDLRLQWTETHDDSSRSQGIIGFDPGSARFYSSAVYSDGSGVQLLTGTMNPAEPLITFTPLAAGAPAARSSADPSADRRLMESFTLTVIDEDHFTWVPLDHGWRAVFTRER